MQRAVIAALLMVLSVAAHAAPKAEPWLRWEVHDAASTATIDHAAWNAFVGRYVAVSADGIHRVAYGRVSAADRADLAAYVDRLGAVPISRFARDEQAAYWINLYNALIVKLVLDHYPVRSIRDIKGSPGLFTFGPWRRKLATVEGEALSLDDIEHRILRPIWRDPRIHYALNCAAVGCPNLARTAYTRANLDKLLNQGARSFINHPRGVLAEDGRLYVSSIYAWFTEDFGGESGVIAHLRQYAAPALAERLATLSRIADHHYDWALNDVRE
jgi:Protein of unknown function, DUF547